MQKTLIPLKNNRQNVTTITSSLQELEGNVFFFLILKSKSMQYQTKGVNSAVIIWYTP